MCRQYLLAFRIKALNNQIKRMMERTAMINNDANLTGSQYAMLGYISEQEDSVDVYQREIEAEFNIRRSTASEMLKLLEQKGYILRINDTVDTRLKKITLTEKAKELDKIAQDNLNQVQERLIKGIPQEEMEQFFKVLDKISDNAAK